MKIFEGFERPILAGRISYGPLLVRTSLRVLKDHFLRREGLMEHCL
jgi:hypothetical protein